ncbi:choice-of-anchor D domain-containing protein [Solirubrobacter soli]|uniref:choice-of-anchor D domain-containing protein n=1 Tax=Solirubrobacter soli TaxID=363832 RepID=UPI00042551DD|nr:choice-of-anchor D domain-containing protein [Solirubrobacter soli]
MKSRTLKHAARLTALAAVAFAVVAPAAQATPPITPVITVTPSVAHPTPGQSITFTMTLSPAPNVGTVALYEGMAIPGCDSLPVVDGVATCTTTGLTTPGLHYINAMYLGSGMYGSNSQMYFMPVNAVTTTTVTASPKLADPGETMLYKSVTTPRPVQGGITSCSGGCEGDAPTETVDFAVDGAPVADCQKRPVDGETGIATCKTAVAPAAGGKHVVTASYSASDNAYLTASTGTDDFTVKTPGIALSATALDFGSVTVGAASTRTVTVSNPGTRALTLGEITAGGAYSVTASTCHPTVDAGTGCELTVSFKPTAAGTAAASLTVASDAGAPVVALTGTATAVAPPTGATLPPNSKTTFTVTTPSSGGTPSVTVPLRCPTGVACTLDGTVVISTSDLVSNKQVRAAATDTQTVARFSGVRVAPGKVREIKLKLSPAFIKKAQKRGIRLIHATLTVNTTFTDGSHATRQEQVVIRIPKPAVKKKAAAKQAPRFTG